MSQKTLRTLVATLSVLATATLSPTGADAQQRVSFDGRSGYSLPSGKLADITDPGVTFGLGASYWVAPRLALTAGGDLELLRGKKPLGATDRAPGLNLWHYNAGAAVNLLRPGITRWEVLANLGAGASTYDPEDETAETLTRFSTNGGLRVGYRMSERADVFVGSQAYLSFTDEVRQGSETNWSFPIHAGLKLRV